MTERIFRDDVPKPPARGQRIRWYGPGLLWMLSAVGTGSILFTPRVASAYEYQLLWMLLLVVFFMWVMIREMARFSIVTGQTMLEGMHSLGGPRNWAVWIIFVPQLLAASVGIAGLAAVIGSAVSAFLPGAGTLYGVLSIGLCTAFTVTGRYLAIERLSRVMAILLMGVAVVSAVLVAPELPTLASGLLLQWPDDPNLYVILPWVGTILAGSMGIVWFGYWTATRGFGGGLRGRERDDELSDSIRTEHRHSLSESHTEELKMRRAREWIRIMSGTATVGVVGGLLVIFSFMVLGAELLAPRGILPQGADVAVDLTRLFSDIWGQAGRLLLLVAIVVALGGSILANQDGWGRSFADMTLILVRGQRRARNPAWPVRLLQWLEDRTAWSVFGRLFLKRVYIFTITGLIPLLILAVFRDPVRVMSASGIIAAAHTPFIVLVTLYVNRTRLPESLRPGVFISTMMFLAGIFYLGFAALYFLRLGHAG